MTRQRLRESSIKWETNLSIESFSQKIIKKIEMLAFDSKTKSINAYVPEKVSGYLNSIFSKEIEYFKKKYSFDIEILPGQNFIIPEYKIELRNKSKKIIKVVENVDKINLDKINIDVKSTTALNQVNEKKILKKGKVKFNSKKSKSPKTLWVRRKKAS